MLTDLLNYTPSWIIGFIAMQLVTLSIAVNYFTKARIAKRNVVHLSQTLDATKDNLRLLATMAQTEVLRQQQYLIAACQHKDVREWFRLNGDRPIYEAPPEILMKLTSFQPANSKQPVH